MSDADTLEARGGKPARVRKLRANSYGFVVNPRRRAR
jgi:hypothetical protein